MARLWIANPLYAGSTPVTYSIVIVYLPRWLVETGTPNGLRSHAFPGSNPGWGTILKHITKSLGSERGIVCFNMEA